MRRLKQRSACRKSADPRSRLVANGCTYLVNSAIQQGQSTISMRSDKHGKGQTCPSSGSFISTQTLYMCRALRTNANKCYFQTKSNKLSTNVILKIQSWNVAKIIIVQQLYNLIHEYSIHEIHKLDITETIGHNSPIHYTI